MTACTIGGILLPPLDTSPSTRELLSRSTVDISLPMLFEVHSDLDVTTGGTGGGIVSYADLDATLQSCDFECIKLPKAVWKTFLMKINKLKHSSSCWSRSRVPKELPAMLQEAARDLEMDKLRLTMEKITTDRHRSRSRNRTDGWNPSGGKEWHGWYAKDGVDATSLLSRLYPYLVYASYLLMTISYNHS